MKKSLSYLVTSFASTFIYIMGGAGRGSRRDVGMTSDRTHKTQYNAKLGLTLLLIVIIGLLLRLYLVFVRPIAPDELWTFYYLKNNLITIIKGSFADFRPPLYYFLLMLWKLIFGETVISYRFFSLFISLPGLIFIYLASKTVFNNKTALFTLYLASISAGLIYDSVDGRMFALSFTISCLILWQTIVVLKYRDINNFIFLLFAFILASYTYLYLLFLIPGILIYVFTLKIFTLKKLFRFLFLFILFLIPFFYFLISSFPYLSSFHELLSPNPIKILTVLIIPLLPSEFIFTLVMNNLTRILFILSTLIFIIIGYYSLRGFLLTNSLMKKITFLYLFLPLTTLLCLSLLTRPLIGIHSLILFTPVIYLLISKACEKSMLSKLVMIVLVTTITTYYFANINLLQTDIRPYDFLKANYQRDNLIIQQDIYPFLWTRYYLNDPRQTSLEKSEFNLLIEKAFHYSYLTPDYINTKKVFLVKVNKNPYVSVSEVLFPAVKPQQNTQTSNVDKGTGINQSENIIKEHGFYEIQRKIFTDLTVVVFAR